MTDDQNDRGAAPGPPERTTHDRDLIDEQMRIAEKIMVDDRDILSNLAKR